ncbi:hypothetical protein BY458DRAFT_432006 [Sporodiniella umbellata]|nr:hypothetical protein BY458DRAFT_432006 [Sporodiniella umbellata]
MWLEYATLVDAPISIFSYLMSMDIGQSLALFYEEYAALLEGDQKYKDAEKIYIQGLERQAAPLTRLEKNYKMFKVRMKERNERGLITKAPNFKLQMEALASGNRTMLGEKIAGQSRSQSSSLGLGGGLRNSRSTPSFEVYTGESTSQIPTPGLPTFNKTENEMVKEQFAGATLPRRGQPRAPIQNFTKFTVYQDPDPEDQSSTPINQTPPLPPPPPSEPAAIRKRRVEDLIDGRLVQRFMENRDKYLQTKDSKGKTEYICCRPETVKGKKKEIRKYEMSTTEDHTAETRAAIKDINTILFSEGYKEEEDLTWTKDIQDEQDDVILKAFTNMGWGKKWTSLSEAFVEGTKNDLKEFAQVLTEDAEEETEEEDHSLEIIRESLASINTVNFLSLKDGLLNALEQQLPAQVQSVRLPENMNLAHLKEGLVKGTQSAEHYLQTFGGDVISALRNTVTVIAPEEQQEVASNPRIYATRKEALLAKMQVDEDTYLKDIEEEEKKTFETFENDFKIEEYTDKVSELLKTYPDLQKTMESIVPVQVSYPVFWQRYFYHAEKIEQDEQKRQLIVQGVKEDDENDFKWDSDDEENTITEAKRSSEDTDDFSHISGTSSTPQQQTAEDDWVKTEKKKKDEDQHEDKEPEKDKEQEDEDSDWE